MIFKILIVDDEPTLRHSLGLALSGADHRIMTAESGEEGLELFRREKPDLILLDHWLPGKNGDAVLAEIHQEDPEIPVIIMTAQGSIELAVRAMKMGAFDFIVKPFDLEQVENLVKRGLDGLRLRKEVQWLREQYEEKFHAGGIVAVSGKMREALALAEKAALGADTTVLIEGETGTGKELLGEYIHFLSPRASFPFVPLNCGAIPQELVESELFGYEKGAFTGAAEKKMGKVEAAERGTLFLDEIGDLPAFAQVKILRFLEEKEFYKVGGVEKKTANVRIIAATNRDLALEAGQGRFREDLYFRINVVRIVIPPLRQRPEDILPLFRFFLERFNRNFNRRFLYIDKEAEEILTAYPWPGNIREVRNTAERIVLIEKGERIEKRHLASLAPAPAGPETTGPVTTLIPPEGISLGEVEKNYLKEALRMTRNNKLKAARLLGISRSALLYRLEKFGIRES